MQHLGKISNFFTGNLVSTVPIKYFTQKEPYEWVDITNLENHPDLQDFFKDMKIVKKSNYYATITFPTGWSVDSNEEHTIRKTYYYNNLSRMETFDLKLTYIESTLDYPVIRRIYFPPEDLK